MTSSQRIEVLMLGWEYPPHISGGLGTACEGLTKALAPLDVSIDFVLPHLYGHESAPHMRLNSPDLVLRELDPLANPRHYGTDGPSGPGGAPPFHAAIREELLAAATPEQRSAAMQTTRIPALLSPYLTPEEYARLLHAMESGDENELRALLGPTPYGTVATVPPPAPSGKRHYGENLLHEVMRYAERVGEWSRTRHPQIVHAHDWMTFPAAARVAHIHGIPMIVHVHSLEQDRSGNGANPGIVSLEGAGLCAATRIIAVSHYTARMINALHGVPFDRIDVVHNGAYPRTTVNAYRADDTRPTVLFLGRITFQKGPDYFVEAAAKVLEQVPEAHFVMAGSGDMLPRLQHRVHELGIEKSFDFPGFVRGDDVERLFSTADVYVMPSVSEPFGISALEAMSYETPVILSRQSGASEILHHALKVDFWDVNKLASQIVAILRYPELRRNIVDMAREEVRRVHWEAAASKVRQTYARVLGGN